MSTPLWIQVFWKWKNQEEGERKREKKTSAYACLWDPSSRLQRPHSSISGSISERVCLYAHTRTCTRRKKRTCKQTEKLTFINKDTNRHKHTHTHSPSASHAHRRSWGPARYFPAVPQGPPGVPLARSSLRLSVSVPLEVRWLPSHSLFIYLFVFPFLCLIQMCALFRYICVFLSVYWLSFFLSSWPSFCLSLSLLSYARMPPPPFPCF